MLGHQISCAHPFSYFVVHKVLYWLLNSFLFIGVVFGVMMLCIPKRLMAYRALYLLLHHQNGILHEHLVLFSRNQVWLFLSQYIVEKGILILTVSQFVQNDLIVYGIKGMVDFGNTDGMNCILQLFLHAPPIRDFFLSDHHNALVWLWFDD